MTEIDAEGTGAKETICCVDETHFTSCSIQVGTCAIDTATVIICSPVKTFLFIRSLDFLE